MDSKWTKAVLEECEKARKELRPISHSCARTIGCMYSQGMDITQAFASSGAISEGLLEALFGFVFVSAVYHNEKEVLVHRDAIRTYIKAREKAGNCFPSSGVKKWNEIYIGGTELSEPLIPYETSSEMIARMNREEAAKRYETLKKKEGIPPSIRRQIDGRMFTDLHVICENNEENFFHVRGSYSGRHDQDTFFVSIGSWCPENFLVHGYGECEAVEVCLDICRELGYKGLVSSDPLDVSDQETVNEMMNDEEGSGDWNERLQIDGSGNYYDPQELHYYEIHAKKDPYFTVIKSDCCPCEICCGEVLEEPELERFWSLREALKAFQEYDISDEQGPIEASSFPWCPGSSCRRSGTIWGIDACDENPACREVSFHMENISASSQKRIMRLIGVYGMEK